MRSPESRCQISAPPTVKVVDAETTPQVAKQGRTQEPDDSIPGVARAVTCAVVGFDRLFREALSSLLHLRVGLRVVAHAENGTAGRDVCLAARPDLIILDFASRGRPELAVAEELLASHTDSRAIVITSRGCALQSTRWLPADRHAVVAREDSFDLLLAALEALFADRVAKAERLAPDGARRRHRPLTDREAQIMTLLGEGLTTREIAIILKRSPHTIQTHRKRIAEKVGRLGSRISCRIASDRHSRGDGATGRG